MAILGIPNVVVLEPVHIDVQAVRVHVHVDNEELYDASSVSLPIRALTPRIVLYVVRDLEVRERTAPTE
jgi:hypothetical protein